MIFNLQDFLKYIPSKPTFVLWGNKLTHSISKNIHEMIFDEFGIDAEYCYLELQKDELYDAICHLKRYFCGANITIPHKFDVIGFLDFVDETALRLGSVNTIKVVDGKTYGYNTDIIGVYETLSLDKISLCNKKVALLGCGGTANVIADILAKNKAITTIFARNLEKSQELKVNTLKNYNNAVINTKLLHDFDDNYDIIFNTTPVGMNDLEGQSPIGKCENSEYVFDCLYNPQVTKLMSLAKNKSRNGLYMLYTQALFAQNIWFDIDVTRTNNIYQKLSTELFLKRLGNKNLVIYGFMGCGKSSVSRILSENTNLELIDTDFHIENNEKKKISDIFNDFGEEYFRKIENDVAKELSKAQNKIISVGGGFFTNRENVELLKQNSYFVFLNRDFDKISNDIKNDENRPLSNDKNLEKLYNSRMPLYNEIADFTIFGNDSIYNNAENIVKNV